MELYSARRLGRESVPAASCKDYLDRLPLSPARRRRLLIQAGIDGDASRDAMVRLHQALARQLVEGENPAYASIRCRTVKEGDIH